MADYPDIIVTSTAWQTGPTLTDDVVVQAHDQAIAISTKADPSGSLGLTLAGSAAINVSSGKTISYRAIGPRGGRLKIEAL